MFNDHKVEDLAVGADPTETVAGSKDLGEGAEVDHEILGVHRLECGQELALEAQLAVGVILDNGNLILVHDLHESLAALKRPCASAGVLEIGDDVDHLHVFGGGEDAVKLLHYHAAVVSRDFDELRLAGLERADSAEVGRAFHHDHVAGVQEEARAVVQTLLAARSYHYVVCVRVDAVFRGEAIGDLLPQGQVALRGAVLKRGAAVLVQDGGGSGVDIVNREKLRRGHAAGKGDDLRTGGELEQLAYVRGFQFIHSVCIINHFSASFMILHFLRYIYISIKQRFSKYPKPRKSLIFLTLFCQSPPRGSTHVFQHRDLRFGIVVNNYAVGLIMMYHLRRFKVVRESVDMLKPPCAAVAVAVVHGDDDLRENLFRQPP